MAAPKRPNYFRSQFLIVRDFQDEQKYHEELLRRHNRLMHEWGVVRDGLQVTKSGDNTFSISSGSAIDSLGREIILDTSRTLSAADVQAARQAGGAGQDLFVTIAFQEVNSTERDDKYPPPGGSENVTRKEQSPIIAATKSPASDGTVVILARVAGDNTVVNSVRKAATSFIARGSNLGDIALDGALSFTSRTSPNPTYPQVGLDYDPAGDQLRIRARSQTGSVLDTTHLTIKRDSGNVGIGTASAPGQKLEVAGALKLSTNPSVTNDGSAAYFWNQANVGPTIAGGNFEVRTGGDTARLRIDGSGKVGIGTTLPATRFHLVGGANALPATSGNVQSVGHMVRMRGSTNASLDMGSGGDKGFWLQSTDLSNLATNYPLLLNPNGGKVGVKTTEPVAQLHVVGSGNALPATSAAAQSAGHIARMQGTTNAVLDIGASEKSFWLQSTDLTNLATNHSLLLNPNGGNVGIGTNAPTTLLHIRKDNQGGLGPTLTLMNGLGTPGAKVHIDLHTYWDDNRPQPSVRIVCEDNTRGSGHLIFQTKEVGAENMLERLRVDASGHIGIGTSDPKASLDVADTTKDTMKSILARLSEANPGTYLGVKAYDTAAKPWPADKSFALEHYFHSKLNSAINFHRGIREVGGYITFSTDQGTHQMRLDNEGLRVEGAISCGGKIGLKSVQWPGRYISAREQGDGWVVRSQSVSPIGPYEQFTLEMACSREFKENISDLTALEAMTTLQNLTPVKYDYKGEKASRQNLGFVAEDMPDNLASEDRKSISPFEVVPILTRVAKEQQRVIAELEETVRALQEDVRRHNK